MERFSRRDFLKAAGIFAGSALLVGCAPEAAKKVNATATGLPVSPTAGPIPVFEPTQEPTKTPEKPFEYPYFDQKDPKWQVIPNSDNGSMWRSGCGVATGAMVTFSDPITFWHNCEKYYATKGLQILLPPGGLGFASYEPVLRYLNFTPHKIEGDLDFILGEIDRFAKMHVPTWLNGVFFGVSKGHNSEAIGVNFATKKILFNDPWYGPNVEISPMDIAIWGSDSGPRNKKISTTGSVYAIIPPAR